MRALALAFALGSSLVAGCGGGAGGDEETDAGDASRCEDDSSCDDGVFCNGRERCDPEAPGADARGCIAGSPPCSGECDEEEERCADGCVDADGDGHQDVGCGGDDCDDTDPDRFPGNVEVCDADGVDEDCDPSTLGPDEDGDGYVADECCNTQPDGSLKCGRDCDDANMHIHPEALDGCGNGDEDCDGRVDEDPDRTYYRDRDGDGFGTPDDTIEACEPTASYVARDTDCDDERAFIHPDAEERCDAEGLDEDCDGSVNEGCACEPLGSMQSCGTTDVGACELGVQDCIADGSGGSVWSECMGATAPSDELCNGEDDDCDGATDEDFDCVAGAMETGINACGRMGERNCRSGSCTWDAADYSRPETSTTCDYCDDTGTGPEEEMGFATESVMRYFDSDELDLLGDAYVSGSYVVLALYSHPDPRLGAAYLPDALPLGYGGAHLEARMSSNQPAGATQPPGNGWAIVMVRDEGESSLLGEGSDALGVPRDRDGIAVEWRRYQDDDPDDDTDSLVVRELRAEGGDPVHARANPRPEAYSDSSAPEQRVEVILGPDFPGTVTNETSLVVRYYYLGSWIEVYSCGPSETACPFAFAAGTPMRFGLSAAVGTGREETYLFDASPGGDITTESTLAITGLCP